MQQVKSLALGALILVASLFGAGPAFAISESSVTSAIGAASVATVSVNAASGASLVALISGDGPSTASSQTTSVSGCGLSWVLVKRANTRPGVADVWKTATSTSLSACAVTGRLVSGSFFVRLTVVVIDGSSGLGASASASGKNGAAKAMLASVQAGSLVYGVGSDWSVVQARTLLSGQRKLAESTPAGLGTFWAQALTGTSLAGSLTVGTSAPNSTNWNFSAVELVSSLAPPPPPPCTFTVSPTTLTAPAAGTSSSVTVTASASTCTWTAASNAWLSVAPTGGTGSGAVSVTSAANSGAVRSASVTVAGTSVTVTQDAAASGPPTLVATCPSPQSATSPDGQPVAVSYPAATTTGGTAPVTVQGSPASGSLFPVGTTMVTQTASSSDGQTSTCTNGVTVTNGSGSSSVGRVFVDGFESGNTNLWAQDDYHARCNVVTTAVVGAAAKSGARAAECNWNGQVAWNDPFAYTGLKLNAWPYTREFLVRVWVRYAADVDHKIGNKALRLYSNDGGSNSYYFDAQMEQVPASMFSHWERMNGQTGATFWGDSVALGNGQWHKVEIYVKHNTSGHADGMVRVWLDGGLKQESLNIVSTTAGGHWYPMYLVSNWSNNPGWEHDASNHIYWDDIEVFSDQGTGGTGGLADGTITQVP